MLVTTSDLCMKEISVRKTFNHIKNYNVNLLFSISSFTETSVFESISVSVSTPPPPQKKKKTNKTKLGKVPFLNDNVFNMVKLISFKNET